MNIISFDIGIKNMAYCILLHEKNQNVQIKKWGILNLMETDETNTFTCNCLLKSKKKDNVCNKKAKYKKNDRYFCESHAKKESNFLIPTKEMEMPFLKKQKVDELLKIARSNFLFLNEKNNKKENIVSSISEFYNTKKLDLIHTKKKKNANETDLIAIGKNMKLLLDNISEISNINVVLIENQISPIANRMKTIQGMLAQYFIMKNELIDIYFISSGNKLKQFQNLNLQYNNDRETNETTKNVNPNYKANKLNGVLITNIILNENEQFHQWKEHMNTSKKDDLADSFLQGLWYFKDRNIISYAEDLKIKLV